MTHPYQTRQERIAESMRLIRVDCEQDAKSLDGMPIDGAHLGPLLGGMLAAIDALAHAIQVTVERDVT